MNNLRLSLCFLVMAGGAVAQTTAPGASQEKARLAGIVRGADGGEPLRRARVTLTRSQARGVQQSAFTGLDGRFLLPDVPPGTYRLVVERNGYVRQEYGQRRTDPRGTPFVVQAGRNVEDLEFRLVRAGIITGRVFDEEGEPVPRVRVAVMRMGYEDGRRAMATVGGAATDDRGEYRVFDLAPGRYYVSAEYRAGRGGGPMFVGGAGEVAEEDAFAIAYYPGTVDPTRATPIEVSPGQQVAGVDFTLVPSRMIRVRGQVTSAVTGQPVRAAQIWFLGRDSGPLGFMTRTQASTNEQGRFEARVVTPGAYYLLASSREDDGLLVGRVPVEIVTSDLEDVNLAVAPGVEISGSVRVEGIPAEFQPERTAVILRPRQAAPFFGGGSAPVKADGTFQMRNVFEETYSVNVSGRVPEDFYLKSARVSGADVLEQGLVVARGRALAGLEITLSSAGARIDGLLLSEEGLPANGVVLLVPPAVKRGLPHLFKTARTDSLGRFSLRGIAPGEYKLFAFEEVEPGAVEDPEFLKPFESRATPVKLAEGAIQSLELKLLPRKPMGQ